MKNFVKNFNWSYLLTAILTVIIALLVRQYIWTSANWFIDIMAFFVLYVVCSLIVNYFQLKLRKAK